MKPTCEHMTEAVWQQGETVHIGKKYCALINQECTEELRKECPFINEDKEIEK